MCDQIPNTYSIENIDANCIHLPYLYWLSRASSQLSRAYNGACFTCARPHVIVKRCMGYVINTYNTFVFFEGNTLNSYCTSTKYIEYNS